MTSVSKSTNSGNSGVSYIQDPTNYWSYQPGSIKLKADYEGDVEVDEMGALGIQAGGATSKEYSKKTYIIEQDGVKKIIEEEIETISMPPVIATGASAQNVSILAHERAKTIKLSHRPVVSDKEKTQIESLDKINMLSFLGCFGGRREAFF